MESFYLLRGYVRENKESVDRFHSDKETIHISLMLSTPGLSTVDGSDKKEKVKQGTVAS